MRRTDDNTHLYTLIIRPDNTFDVMVDMESKRSGSLLDELEPPINPEEMVDDQDDFKPVDWIDDPKMADPNSVKPDDWDDDAPREIVDEDAIVPNGWLEDEDEYVDDPDAEIPDDWDDEEDGEWEAPQVGVWFTC